MIADQISKGSSHILPAYRCLSDKERDFNIKLRHRIRLLANQSQNRSQEAANNSKASQKRSRLIRKCRQTGSKSAPIEGRAVGEMSKQRDSHGLLGEPSERINYTEVLYWLEGGLLYAKRGLLFVPN